MNKKRVIIVTLILVILFIILYVVYQEISLALLPNVTGVVVDKNDKTITIKESVDTTQISYELCIENEKPKVKNINGKEINLSSLNIGDKIKVKYKKEDISNLLAGYPESIDNIKLIEIIEDNSDNHMTKDDLSYNHFFATLSYLENEELAFSINSFNRNYSLKDFFSSELKIKIVKKCEDNKEKEIKQYESLKISYSEFNEDSCDIIINNANYNELQEELEIGKYVLKIENEKGEKIKIPFEKVQLGGLQWHNY